MKRKQSPEEIFAEAKVLAIEIARFAERENYLVSQTALACMMLAAGIMADDKKMALQSFADMLDHSEQFYVNNPGLK